MRFIRPGLAAICVSAVAIIMGVMAVQAHGELEKTEPPAEAVLLAAPAKVRLWYTEPIDPVFSEIVVYDESGSRVDAGDSGFSQTDPKLLEVSLARRGVGTFTVEWRIFFKVDGHLTSGTFRFHVGGLSRALSSAGSSLSARPNLTPLSVASKWLGIGAGLVLVGGAAFWSIVFRPPVAKLGPQCFTVSALVAKRLQLLGLLALACLIVALVFELLALNKGAGAGTSQTELADLLFATNYGRAWLARLGLWSSLVALSVWFASRAMRAGRSKGTLPSVGEEGSRSSPNLSMRWMLVVAGIGVGLLSAYSAVSHLAASSGIVGVLLDLVHLMAAATWLGGLVALVVVAVPPMRTIAPESRSTLLKAVVRRFSSLAMASVGLLLATGVVAAILQFDRLSDLTGTAYGRTLLVKLGLLTPLLALGFLQLSTVSYRLFLPRMFKATSSFSRLLTVGRSELGLAGMVLAAAVLMSLLSPASSGSLAASRNGDSDQAAPLRLLQTVGDMEVTLDMDPRKIVVGRMLITLKSTATGRPLEGAVITNKTYRLDGDLGVVSVQASSLGGGRYETGGLPWRPGMWRIELQIALLSREPIVAPFELNLGPERSDLFLALRPGPSDPAAEQLLAQTAARMRALTSLRFDQVVDSGTGKNSVEVFAIVEAPDRFYLRTESGAEFIRIGSTMYDRESHGLWSKSSGLALEGPSGFWAYLNNAVEVQLEGREQHEGRWTRLVSFLRPDVPIKYWEWIDEESGHIVREVMVAKGHYMTTEFKGFDLPPSIEPPQGDLQR